MARKMATAPKGEIFHVSNFIHSLSFRVPSLPPFFLSVSSPLSFTSILFLSFSWLVGSSLLYLFFLLSFFSHVGACAKTFRREEEEENRGVGNPENICYSGEQVLGSYD